MIRKHLNTPAKEHKDRIKWRGHEVTRIEAFSDAVFAFAITLLIVSLEVPKTAKELLENLKGFVPFSICFAIMFTIWYAQNTFFRRFGLHDTITITLNGVLLFMVLFYVYPLKFLFTGMFLHNSFSTPEEMKILMCIYSGGFVVIYLLFAFMYLHALRQRVVLNMTDSEIFEARTTVYQDFIISGVGTLSVITVFAGLAQFSGIIYILIWPSVSILHYKRGKLHRIKYETGIDSLKLGITEPVNDDI